MKSYDVKYKWHLFTFCVMRYRPQIQPSLRLHTVLFVVLVGSLSNDDGDGYGYENVTGKVNSRCLVKCWQMSLELNSKGLYQSSRKEKQDCCFVLRFSTKREIRCFHIVVVQRRQRNIIQKCVMHVQSCYFAILKLINNS